jgi:hypothetical protein
MSDAQATLDRVERTRRKLDALGDYQYEKAKRDIAEMRRADDAAEDWRRDTMRRHSARCDEHQARYDEAFEPHGKRAPPPLADDYPPDYRRQLFAIGQSMLPSGHDLTGFSPDDLDGTVIVPYEKMLFEALRKEAERPTGDNLPRDVYDPKARREVFDDSQRKLVVYLARKSFIKDWPEARPGRRVAAILDKGSMVWPRMQSVVRAAR